MKEIPTIVINEDPTQLEESKINNPPNVQLSPVSADEKKSIIDKPENDLERKKERIKMLERKSHVQKGINELTKKVDTIRLITNKLNDYYENNLKYNSVAEMANSIKDLYHKLESRAPILELKKVQSRLRKYNFR